MDQVKLYVIPGSHPSKTVELMLQYKGMAYKRIDLIPAVAKPILRLVGFRKATVPALKAGNRKVQGSRTIAQELDRIQPEPPLFPVDSDQRVRVLEAEQWGDEFLQPLVRRLLWWCLRKHTGAMVSFSEGAKLGVPVSIAKLGARPVSYLSAKINGVSDEVMMSDLKVLPEYLDRIDGLIEAGVVGGRSPNAADFQIGTCVRLLICLQDIGPLISGRPLAKMALAVARDYPGSVPKCLPSHYLSAL